MTSTTYLTRMTDEELARTLADMPTNRPALLEADCRRDSFFESLDPSYFEGTPESGPCGPPAPIDIALAEARSDLRRRTARGSLQALHLRWRSSFEKPGAMLMDACFRIADEGNCSPLYIRRLAAELKLAPEPTFWEERAFFYRMDLDNARRSAEEAA